MRINEEHQRLEDEEVVMRIDPKTGDVYILSRNANMSDEARLDMAWAIKKFVLREFGGDPFPDLGKESVI